MTAPLTCAEPGCGGIIQDGLCPVCGALYQGPAAVSAPSPSTRSSSVSARPSSMSSMVGSTSSSKRSRQASFRSISTRRTLGGGLVDIPLVPDVEALKVVRPGLQIPENQRTCSNPQCLDDDGRPLIMRLPKGFCPKCRARYSFLQIEPGTVLSGQYEIKGPIAIGGCGFVYLAMDKNVERYVVVKGLINSMDAAAAANAVKEKRFLSELRDPHIVDIVNFVNHEGGQYIVMEFVNGVTLKDIRKERGALPVVEAVAYTLAMLPAFQFLHDRKVIYCDFKIENAMVQRDRVRLIDLGGARRLDDLDSDLYLTQGYAAPEAEQSPSVASDLYTVGRTLAVLMMDFDFRKSHRYTLPTPQEVPKFGEYESLYRFLLRATAKDPSDRFQSADEMASQLEGVLREIVALETGNPRPTESLYFGVDIRCESATAGLDSLPSMRIDTKDPARALVESALVLNDPHIQKTLFENALVRFPASTEAALRLADSCIGLKQFDEAETILTRLANQDAYDWRLFWLRGRLKIAQGDPKGSLPMIDAVFSELPGELAPKLGLAIVSELSGDLENAIRLYDLVSRVDPGYITAAFGLARCLRVRKDRKAAVSAYARVATTSIAYMPSLMDQVRTLIEQSFGLPVQEDLAKAGDTMALVKTQGAERFRLEADLLLSAATLLETKQVQPNDSIMLLGVPLRDASALRVKAEAALRSCARVETEPSKCRELIDEANRIRPWSLF